MRVYADGAQLDAYPGGSDVPEDDRPALLRTASLMVDELLLGKVYATTAAGLPRDTDDAQAMANATCAIVAELAATGTTAAGGTQGWESVGIGSVSLSGAKSTEGTRQVHGLPVPATAVLELSSVGRVGVWVL